MTPYILCAIDYLDPSLRPVAWAADMAKQLNAHLTILSAYRLHMTEFADDMVQLKKQIEQQTKGRFTEIEASILKDQKISYDFKSEVGFVRDRVEDHAKRKQLLFLVVGRHANLANEDVLNELISRVNIPLVIIP